MGFLGARGFLGSGVKECEKIVGPWVMEFEKIVGSRVKECEKRTPYNFNDSQKKGSQVDSCSNELSDIFEGGNTQRTIGMRAYALFILVRRKIDIGKKNAKKDAFPKSF